MRLLRTEYTVVYNEDNAWNISSKRYKSKKQAQDFAKMLKESSHADNIHIESWPIYTEEKKKKPAKKKKRGVNKFKVGRSVTFKTKAGGSFMKTFKSQSSKVRAKLGWRKAGGKILMG